MPGVQLDSFAAGVLDASGNATVRIGPTNNRQTWTVTIIAVSSSSVNNVPTATAYLGTPSPGSSLGGTYDGANDSTDVNVFLHPGQQITVQFLGGDPGASATVSVYGTMDTLG